MEYVTFSARCVQSCGCTMTGRHRLINLQRCFCCMQMYAPGSPPPPGATFFMCVVLFWCVCVLFDRFVFVTQPRLKCGFNVLEFIVDYSFWFGCCCFCVMHACCILLLLCVWFVVTCMFCVVLYCLVFGCLRFVYILIYCFWDVLV